MADYKMGASGKPEVFHAEYTRDSDIVDNDVSKEEATQMASLTEEEQVLSLKLRKKIDSLVMPLVVLVYLMNYIDRYVSWHTIVCNQLTCI